MKPLHALALALFVTLGGSGARADEPGVEEARRLFTEGTAHVTKAEWSKALRAFEASSAVRPHAITTYNIAACHRAIGAYARARATFVLALAEDKAAGGQLPDSLRVAAGGFVEEIDRLVAHVTITLSPGDARIAVDGAPLVLADGAAAVPRLVAGLAPPGAGTVPPAATFEVVVDPGTHIVVLSRKGFQEIALNRTLAPASVSTWKLELDKLPGTLRIAANRDRAIVTVSGADVGVVPVEVSRPAGSYHVVVQQDGFVPYDANVTLQPGEQLDLRAALPPQATPLYKRWWFWSAAAAVAGGVVVGTYFATRPAPTRPPLDGGGLGWTVPLK